ncbi:MAG: ABC transporter ATP-binding protein [Ilumatobacter sp.]|uniref:ABC transporter ATP-binding protein n=1 Tax=Ilumatobacter sp. TaxID=1967498 RepID=UPI00391BA100
MLSVDDLRVTIPTRRGEVYAVRDASFTVAQGEKVAILGESGSGKSMTVTSLIGLQPPNAVVSGRVNLDGVEVDISNRTAVRRHLLSDMSIVFQDSQSSLNPTQRIGEQLEEVLEVRGVSGRRAWERCLEMLKFVGVSEQERRMRNYPHELSGGMRQRVMIAIALLAEPKVLIADEPTTALDTTIQAQVIDLIQRIQAETEMSLIMITHDVALAAEVCDRAVVMYGGYVVEDVPMSMLTGGDRHPYTKALLSAMPTLDAERAVALTSIKGEPPSATTRFAGCPFAERCYEVINDCREGLPAIREIRPRVHARCIRRGEEP